MKSIHDFKNEDAYNRYLRRYYAGLAMQGMLAGLPVNKAITPEELALQAIYCADALIKSLNE